MTENVWQNIFYQPRSGSGGQYELNVTASLLSVLAEDTVSRTVEYQVVRELCSSFDISVPKDATVQYSREVTPNEIPAEGEPRVIIGISPFADDQIPAEPEESEEDYADGCIRFFISGQPLLTIIIEVKNDSSHLRSEQLVRYADRFNAGVDVAPAQPLTDAIDVFSWEDLHTSLQTAKAERSDKVERFVLDRFLDFLWENEVKKYIGVNVVQDLQPYPVHKFYWKIRRNTEGQVETKLVDQYREYLSENEDAGTAVGEANKLTDLYKEYQTRWYTATEFESYLGQIPEPIRRDAFIGDTEEPSLEPLKNNKKQLGPESAQNNRDGDSLIAEFERGGKYSQLHILPDDEPNEYYLDFGLEYSNNGRKQDTLELRDWELKASIAGLPMSVRRALFIEFDFEVLAEQLSGPL